MSTSSSSTSPSPSGPGASTNPLNTTTPASSKPKNPKSKYGPAPRPFTEKLKDRQARNKNPYASSDSSDDEWHGRRHEDGRADGYETPSYETLQTRREAAIILDSPELLMMHAQARCDTIPRTRLHFTKLLCGMDKEVGEFPITAGYAAQEGKEKRDRKDRKTI